MDDPRASSLTAFLALFLLSATAFFWMIAGFLVALFMGQVLALLLAPLYARLRPRTGPSAASLLCVLALSLGILAPLTGFGFVVARDAARMEKTVAESGGLTIGALADRLDRLGLGRLGVDPARARRQATLVISEAAKASVGAAASAARSVPRVLVELTVALLTAFFLLRDEDSLLRLALAPLPLDPETLSEAQAAFHSTTAATVWSALAVALVQGACVFCAFALTGLRGAALGGGLAFVGSWVPLIGSAPIWLAGGAWLAYQGQLGRILVLCVFAGIGQAADHIMRPLLLRGRARLHPLLGLVSVLGGVTAFGLSGVFIGPILGSLLAALYRVWPRTAARYRIDVKPTVVGPGGGPLS